MPELSRFFGIIITLYYDDHGPPHFHVRYGSQRAIVSIDGLSVIAGELSPRVRGLVVDGHVAGEASVHVHDVLVGYIEVLCNQGNVIGVQIAAFQCCDLALCRAQFEEELPLNLLLSFG